MEINLLAADQPGAAHGDAGIILVNAAVVPLHHLESYFALGTGGARQARPIVQSHGAIAAQIPNTRAGSEDGVTGHPAGSKFSLGDEGLCASRKAGGHVRRSRLDGAANLPLLMGCLGERALDGRPQEGDGGTTESRN